VGLDAGLDIEVPPRLDQAWGIEFLGVQILYLPMKLSVLWIFVLPVDNGECDTAHTNRQSIQEVTE